MNKLGLFLFGLIFISCTKLGKNITVKGCVLNTVAGKGIPDVEVIFTPLLATMAVQDRELNNLISK